jgi:hypothetical protein
MTSDRDDIGPKSDVGCTEKLRIRWSATTLRDNCLNVLNFPMNTKFKGLAPQLELYKLHWRWEGGVHLVGFVAWTDDKAGDELKHCENIMMKVG